MIELCNDHWKELRRVWVFPEGTRVLFPFMVISFLCSFGQNIGIVHFAVQNPENWSSQHHTRYSIHPPNFRRLVDCVCKVVPRTKSCVSSPLSHAFPSIP